MEHSAALKVNMENIPVRDLEKLVFINSDGLKELNLEGELLTRVPDAVTKLTDVEVLNLSNNNLTGLPHDIGHLFNLKTLQLKGNELRQLPRVVSQLTKLVILDVSGNQLTTISNNVKKLQRLQDLDLSNNRLQKLPEVVCQLMSLIKLDMSHNQLTTISHNITKLQQLQDLDLSNNLLGEVLEVICQLKKLIKLNMSHNQLTTIPDNITKLVQLEELDLSNNRLGEIPDVICQLKKLTKLNVSWNHLTTIQNKITELQQLQDLDLSGNRLEEIPQVVCQLKKLTKLNMSWNQLTTIPNNITELQQLQDLDLSHNGLHGNLLEVICKLTKLIKLNTSNNQLTSISDNFTKLQQLLDLDLSYNRLGEIPEVICQLASLIKLNMSSNQLTTLPDNMNQLQQLQELKVSYNRLGVLPEVICQLANLIKLNMANNQLTTIPNSITKLEQLQDLDLSENRLGEVPGVICQLKKLTKLNMSWNQLTTISHNITKLEQLKNLDLSDNRLGEIPEVIFQFTKLTSLIMSWNQLTTISNNITKLQQLKKLDLRHNNLGEIPEVIFQLTKLTSLNMSSNQLTSIPNNITKLEELKELDLGDNRLEEIPEHIFRLAKLIRLNMSWNQLTTIPGNITNLHQLQELYLSNNRLVELPEAVCQLTDLIKLKVSNNQLTAIPDHITKLQQLRELYLRFNTLREIPEGICQLKGLIRLMVDENPLKVPPVVICKQGLPAIRTYFLDVRRGKTLHHKLVLLGSSGAGKTSLAKTLVNNKPSCVRQEDRTIVLDRIAWETGTEKEIMSISIMDFGGNEWYKIVHHLFLDKNSLLLLVVNLARYSEEIFHEDVRSWLDVIASRVPKASVLLVGTHVDCFENEEELSSRRSQVLQDVSCLVKDGNGQSINVVSEEMITVSSKAFTGIADLRDLILNLVSKNGQVIPSSWSEIYNFFQSSEIMRDQPFLTLDAVKDVAQTKSKDQDLEGSERSKAEVNGNNELLNREEVNRRTETVLTFFHNIGALLWFEHSSEIKKFVFHRAGFLTDLMKAVFSERLSAQSLSYKGCFKDLFTSDSLEEAKKDLLERGIMSHDLLKCLWKHLHLEGELFNAMIELFVHLDLCFSMDETVAQSRLRFPWFLTNDAPKTHGVQTMFDARPAESSYRLSLKYVYPARCPPPLYHIFVVRLHRHVHDIKSRHDWKDGMYASVEETQVLVQRSDKSTEKVISVSVEGSDLVEVWTVLRSCHEELKGVMKDWAGIRWDCWILCPHCARLGIQQPGRFDAKNLEMKCPRGKVTCDRHDERVPACLVYPVGDDFSRHQKGLEEFNKQGNQDAVSLPDSQGSEEITCIKTGSPSLEELHLLAQDVCSSWKPLGRELCITDVQLIQIEADNQGLYEQCYSMLKRWKQVQAFPPTHEDLARALQSKPVGRGDLAAKYCSGSGAQESREVCSPIMNWSFKDGKPTEEEVLSLAKDLQEGNWKQLGRTLKLVDSDLCEIDHDERELFEKIHAMLLKWKEGKGVAASYRDLAEGLDRVGRRDLIREFCCVRK